MICLGRFISGTAVGLLSATVALYQSELAPKNLRGGLTSMPPGRHRNSSIALLIYVYICLRYLYIVYSYIDTFMIYYYM